MEKLLNVENDWDGEVDCPDVMGRCCLITDDFGAEINGELSSRYAVISSI